MNVINEVEFAKGVCQKFKKMLVTDVNILVAEVDGEGSIRKIYEGTDRIIMDKDWCVPIYNMKYDGLTLVINDKNIVGASFKVEQIEEWTLSNSDRIVIGPFSRKTSDSEYLKPYKMKKLFEELCSVGTYVLNVRTKTSQYRIEIQVIDAW